MGGVAEPEGDGRRLVELEFQGVTAVVTAGAAAVAALSLEIETRDVSEAVTDPRAEESDFGLRVIRGNESAVRRHSLVAAMRTAGYRGTDTLSRPTPETAKTSHARIG